MANISRLKTAEISPGNTIAAADIEAELDQLVNELNSKETRLDDLEGSNMTIGGDKTFSGNTIFSNPIKVTGTPDAAGEIGYASNTLKYYNGTSVVDILPAVSAVSAKSGTYTAAASDFGALHTQSGTYTVNLTAAATLGSKWYLHIRNVGTGIITIDGNSSETIDGSTTIKVYQGEAFVLVCDGSNFHTVGRSKGLILITSQTASGSTSIDFTTGIDSSFDEYEIHWFNVKPATDNVNLLARVTHDGATWEADATDYSYAGRGFTEAGAANDLNGTGNTSMFLNGATLGNATNETSHGFLKFFDPAGTSEFKHFVFQTGYNGTTTNSLYLSGMGKYKGATTAITGVRLLMSSGNISTGTFQLYGVRK